MSSSPASGTDGQDRGLSSTVGFALTIALVILGSTAVLALGSVSLTSTQHGVQTERAEKVMTEFDSRSAMVALGDAESQSISLIRGMDGRYVTEPDRGWMRVEVTNTSSGSTETIMNVTLGSVVYENDETRIAYEGGGVWRKSRENGSQMVSPPEFHYRNATLTLPVVSVGGPQSTGTTLSVTRNGSIRDVYPNTTEGRFNPLENGRVEVTVHSDYYQAWGDYFEERTEGDASMNHSQETASVELVVPSRNPPVRGGLVTGATSLIVKNNAIVDSYNSSAPTGSPTGYPASGPPASADGTILASGEVDVRNGIEIHGDVETGGDAVGQPNAEIHGNLSFGGVNNLPPGVVQPGFWTNNNGTGQSPDSVESVIHTKVATFASTNDNSDHSAAISDLESGNPGTHTLTAGNYHLSNIEIPGGGAGTKRLVLDTSSGDINIAVDGNVDFLNNNNLNVRVDGDNRVNFYIEDDLTIENGVEIETNTPHEHDAPRVWFYLNPNETVLVDNGAQVTGVIYGPDIGNNAGADVTLNQNAHVFGAVVGSTDFASNNVVVSYDTALSNSETVTGNDNVPSVTYLHISVNRLNVTSAG